MRGEIIGKKRKWVLSAIIIAVVGILSVFAFDKKLTVSYYEVKSNKISENVRIAFITDLHSCYYGEGQKELLTCIDEQQPDVVLFGGDIVDDVLPPENAVTVLKAAAEKYPCYYVSGNHEYRSGRIAAIKRMIAGYGIEVLEGQSKAAAVKKQTINICGVDDAKIGDAKFMQQIENAEGQADPALFTIFMAHRPEYIDNYLRHDFDLILSGHAHGGQWRIPGILSGFLAPNQGFFPKYAGGIYEFGDKTFIVSRGLARESTRVPRIFNPPELVVIDIIVVN